MRNADDIFNVKYEAQKQKYSWDYAAGPEVSNDNDVGEISFENRFNRLYSCLFGYESKMDKLPIFMQINDIFPLSSYVNTHQLMLNAKQMNGSDAWTECERHYDGILRTDFDARNYTDNVYRIISSFY